MTPNTHEHEFARNFIVPEKQRAKQWYIYTVDNLREHVEIRSSMPATYASAMDHGMFSFDLVASKILNHYTPEQNPFL